MASVHYTTETTGKKPLNEMTDRADVTILKEPGNAMQDDVGEESFNPPFHSTTVYTEDDDPLAQDEDSAKQISQVSPVNQEKSMRTNKTASKSQTVAIPEPSAHKPDAVTNKSHRTPQTAALQIQESGSSNKCGSPKNLFDGTAHPSQAPPPTTPNSSMVCTRTAESHGQQNTSGKKKTSKTDKKNKVLVEIWNPKDMPRSARDMNELDTVLFESQKLIEVYKETVEENDLRIIDGFFDSFKGQLTTYMREDKILKDLKRKNTKMQLEMGRERKRFIDLNREILDKQLKLKQLEKECSEQEEMQDTVKNARAFLDNLGHLQDDHMKFKTENPHTEETYGISSLPALLLEAESILKAENHFHSVNTQLQSFLDKERGDV